MGFYADNILPRIIDLAMRDKEVARLRAEWIPKAGGDVLEIGMGSGRNLPFYSSEVHGVYGVDPSPKLQEMARRRASDSKLAVEFLPMSAENRLPLDDASIDTAVSTFTLCSIPDVQAALREVKRVLKPSGRLIFVEHGRTPEPRANAWQDRLQPTWKRLFGGCHLSRKIDDLIAQAGFRVIDLKTEYLPGPRALRYIYEGIADV